jgi:hypothetical protein
MSEQPADDEISKTPFDDFSEGQGTPAKRSLHLARIAAFLRVLSALALIAAFATAVGIILLDALHCIRPDISWRMKSAIPLICIGSSYALLQFTIPRSLIEFCLSLAVSLAFILWGVEQFIPVPWIASMVDDVVVFLFVLDLSIVIRGQLMQTLRRPRE